jgi:hypothetical protein
VEKASIFIRLKADFTLSKYLAELRNENPVRRILPGTYIETQDSFQSRASLQRHSQLTFQQRYPNYFDWSRVKIFYQLLQATLASNQHCALPPTN